MNQFNAIILSSAKRVAMPIATYPALRLTGANVADIVTNPAAQYDAQAALQQRYNLRFALTAMDLSAEAEAFGSELYLAENEIPSVTGRLVTTLEQARKLPVPKPGDKRTSVYLESVRQLKKLPGFPLVLGGCIGPFSLAARLVGVSEALELTLSEPELMETAIEKSATFLAAYARAFRDSGADGLIMAEPAAGLLSPRAVSKFSSAWIKQIAAGVNDGKFAFILHNCAAKLLHLRSILETGLSTFHFGAPMDLPGGLAQVDSNVVLCGNLEPTGVFCYVGPQEVKARTSALLEATAGRANYVVSSGCDLPPATPLQNLDAFFAAVTTS